jgi:16S rRNA (adenine1518-N6/adenine1519-N6)-dimethyltransferase
LNSSIKFTANKDLGQHFLRDQSIIKKITTLPDENLSIIIEVGPGPAVLTKHLAELKRDLFLIEADHRFEQVLLEQNPKKLFLTDALKFNFEDFIREYQLADQQIWMVSNLPYNISVPLIINFLQVPQIRRMALMMQKEVGERILMLDQKNEMGSLKALCQNYFQCDRLCKVLPGAFSPPPKVDSVVIDFTRRLSPLVKLNEFNYFETFLKLLFANRRKMVRQSLKKIFIKTSLEEIEKITHVDTQRRAETFTLPEIYSLYHLYQSEFATPS